MISENRMIAICLAIMLTACQKTSSGTEQAPTLPAPGGAIEGLAGDPMWENIIGVVPTVDYQVVGSPGPILLYSETSCRFDGGFVGTGKMWFLPTKRADLWREVELSTEPIEDSDRVVSDAELLDEWWVVAAIPDEGAGFVFQCQDGPAEPAPPAESLHESTEADLAPTPELPRRWHPFDEWPGDEDYEPYENEDDLDLTGPLPAGCPTRVQSFDLYLTGQVRGNLSFNQRKRGGPKYAHPMNNGNTTLGGFESRPYRILSWKSYKYQVEIRFLGPFQHAFFGQMASDPQSWSFSDPEFHDDSPANDWVGKEWHLLPGEQKSSYPVIEIVPLTTTDHIVRYIDAPGGSETVGVGLSDKYMYFIIYAGVCGVVTDIKYLQIYYPDTFRWTNGTPIANEMDLAQFRDAVGNWSFEE